MAINNLTLSPDEKLAQKLEAGSTVTSKPSTPSGQAVSLSTDQPVDQPVTQPVDQSTNQSTDQLSGPPVERPVAFYIPKLIHKKIDEAVHYYQEHRNKKIDRSAVVSAILGDPNLWTDESLDRLADQVVDQLTNRLTSRLTG